jgi:hypothetical protein
MEAAIITMCRRMADATSRGHAVMNVLSGLMVQWRVIVFGIHSLRVVPLGPELARARLDGEVEAHEFPAERNDWLP